ncbi:MAG: flagellar hook-basal body protein [Thermaerobacterales bacterium]
MLRGLYQSASAMLTYQARHESISTNLANVNTSGYKAVRPAVGSFGNMLLHRMAGGFNEGAVGPLGADVALVGSVSDFTPGTLRETNEELDIALEGEGLFTIATPDGIRYTRNGEFGRDALGRLITAQGWLVLADDGQALNVGSGVVRIDEAGAVFSDEAPVGSLGLVVFDQPAFLAREDGGRFAVTEAAGDMAAAVPTVRQGFVEASNVDASQSMVDLMATFRAYEANQQVIEAQNDALRLAVNELARF